jgi:hypothetical protein
MNIWLELVQHRLPTHVPHTITNTGWTTSGYPGDTLSITAGVEVDGRWEDYDYAVAVLAVADGDYEQWAFMQIAHRPEGQSAYGAWRYVFTYRGGDSSWDEWQVDLAFDNRPSCAEFGAYVDTHGSA